MALAAWAMERVRAARPERQWGEIVLLLLDDRAMAAANAAVFRRAEPTDTITQPYAPAAAREPWTAELLVNVERAAREGTRRAGGPDRELALYVFHAAHHLTGADDSTPAQRRRMRARENAWLRAAAKEGLLKGLFAD